ncbi:glycosyl transferase family 2 [Candidatus Peregrinibacteria bacterium]|nr:MAG: glycosyl transferase family 2 [Candidatus Peregrinibacteria bacterium]
MIHIAILDFMKGHRVAQNVESILQQNTNFSFKISIIDNSCNNGNAKILQDIIKKYPQVTLSINKENNGYTQAYNQAFKKSDSKYFMILNPDIHWRDPQALQTLYDFLESNTDVGIVGPKQITHNGRIEMTVRDFPNIFIQIARRTFFRNWPIIKQKVYNDEMAYINYDLVQNVPWIQSSCMIIKKSLWQDIGGFNEDYFLFMSDTEICLKAWERKSRVVYVPTAIVEADGVRLSRGGFSSFFTNKAVRIHFLDSVKYMKRHIFSKKPIITQ